jgi:hypothetical protein
MPRYLIERTFPHGVDVQVDEVLERNADEGVTWLHSYVSDDGRRCFDVYESPSPEAIRRTSSRSRLPLDRIIEVRMLDPHHY